MATLADQVREMLRILEVVDPQAAARLKGQSVSPVTYATPALSPEPSPVPVAEVQSRTLSAPVQIKQTADTGLDHPLLSDVSTEHLVQGIIWSEVLGKPVCRRRSRRI